MKNFHESPEFDQLISDLVAHSCSSNKRSGENHRKDFSSLTDVKNHSIGLPSNEQLEKYVRSLISHSKTQGFVIIPGEYVLLFHEDENCNPMQEKKGTLIALRFGTQKASSTFYKIPKAAFENKWRYYSNKVLSVQQGVPASDFDKRMNPLLASSDSMISGGLKNIEQITQAVLDAKYKEKKQKETTVKQVLKSPTTLGFYQASRNEYLLFNAEIGILIECPMLPNGNVNIIDAVVNHFTNAATGFQKFHEANFNKAPVCEGLRYIFASGKKLQKCSNLSLEPKNNLVSAAPLEI